VKTVRTEICKAIKDNAIAFDRKLLAIYLKNVLTADELAAITTGTYKAYLCEGILAAGISAQKKET
jgi:hypothetical protein